MSALTFKYSSKPFRIDYNPGCHGIHSPIVGSRAEELQRIYEKIEDEPILAQFEDALYYKKNSDSFNYLIPVSKKKEACEYSRNIFLKYIEPYNLKDPALSENTVVDWCLFTQSPGETRVVSENAARNHLGWHVTAKVRTKEHPIFENNGYYLPPYLVAYHEIQHVEDTSPLGKFSLQGAIGNLSLKKGTELKETLKTQLLCDEVHKHIHGVGLYSEWDHRKYVCLGEKEIPLYSVLNFYRKLEERHNGSLCEALLSQQSIEFLQKGGI